jgi:hypothetical protein
MEFQSTVMQELRYRAEIQRVPSTVKKIAELLISKSMGIEHFDGLHIQRKLQIAARAAGNDVESAVMAITWIQDFNTVRHVLYRLEQELREERPEASSFEPLAMTKDIEEEIKKNIARYGEM